jgi:hypothetical protein
MEKMRRIDTGRWRDTDGAPARLDGVTRKRGAEIHRGEFSAPSAPFA